MDSKDSVKYQSRKFKLSLSGVTRPDPATMLGGGTFTWSIPPPSDIAFSDKYRSCLILLRSVNLMNIAGPFNNVVATGQITGGGMNPVWVSNGTAAAANLTIEDPCAGIMIETNLPCKQHNGAQFATAPIVAAPTTGVSGSGRYCKTIPNACGLQSNFGETGAAYQAMEIEGTPEIRFGGVNAIVAGQEAVVIQRRPIWSYETDADILEEGLLGATPFGRNLTITLKDAITNNQIWLKSGAVDGGAGLNDHQQTAISCEFEFLMMP